MGLGGRKPQAQTHRPACTHPRAPITIIHTRVLTATDSHYTLTLTPPPPRHMQQPHSCAGWVLTGVLEQEGHCETMNASSQLRPHL